MTSEEVLQRHLLVVEKQPPSVDPSPVATRAETVTSSAEGTPTGRHGNGEEGAKDRRKLSVKEIVSM